jgi:hypothetical protein
MRQCRLRVCFNRFAEQPLRFAEVSTLELDQTEQVQRLELLFVGGEYETTVKLCLTKITGGMRPNRAAQRLD